MVMDVDAADSSIPLSCLLSLMLMSVYTTLESHSPCEQEWQLDLHVAGYLVWASKPVIFLYTGPYSCPNQTQPKCSV